MVRCLLRIIYLVCLFVGLIYLDLRAQQFMSMNNFSQWRECFFNQMSLWDGGASFCLEFGKTTTNEIFLTNLYYYSYIHRFGQTNVIRCPGGMPYKESFTLESGPFCPIHPITGAELISPFMTTKTIHLKHVDLVRLLQKENPIGARRYALLHVDVDEEAKEHDNVVKQILLDALSDDDEILRYIAEDTVEEFQKHKISWALTLTNTLRKTGRAK